MPLPLSQLIAAIGDANIQVQSLPDCLVEAKSTPRGAMITFVAPADIIQNMVLARSTGQRPRYAALVLWIPSDKIPEAAKL